MSKARIEEDRVGEGGSKMCSCGSIHLLGQGRARLTGVDGVGSISPFSMFALSLPD